MRLVISTAASLLLGASLATCASGPSGASPVPTLLTSPTTAVESATPFAAVTPMASPSPSPSPSPQPSAGTTPTPPSRRSPQPSTQPPSSSSPSAAYLYGLAGARLDLPARPAGLEGCAQGLGVQFVNGRSSDGTDPWVGTQIDTAIETDADHDGTPEVVAEIRCLPPGFQASFTQVIAFDRRVDGTFATMGLVVQSVPTDGSPANANVIANVLSLQAAPVGGVRVEVGDLASWYVDTGTSSGLTQQRTYGWNGITFVQTAGPTSFLVPPGSSDLSVSASPMTYAGPVNGSRAGSMTVTIRNAGATTARGLSVLLAMAPPADCADPGAPAGPTCVVGSLAPSATATVTFHHAVDACEPGSSECVSGADPSAQTNPWASLQVRIGDQKYSEIQPLPVAFN